MTCIRPGDCAVCQESIRDPCGSSSLTSASDAGLLIGVPAGAYTAQLYTNAAIEARSYT